MRTLVYRVERDDGQGPYHRDTKNLMRDLDMYREWDAHPSVRDDVPGFVSFSDDICGFSSVLSLCAWFPAAAHRPLAAEGFRVAVYALPARRIKRGRKQIAFDRRIAVLVERRPFPSLLLGWVSQFFTH